MAGTALPRVTLTWAQGLDGSIALEAGTRLRLSGPESAVMTHALRAAHDAILVGIGTVLADDPRLDVRKAPGPNPRPVVLDPSLRTPLDSRLVLRGDLKPWIVAARDEADPARRAALEEAGCTVIEVEREAAPPASKPAGGGLELRAVLEALAARGIGSLMVEGGAKVLASFIHARLADRIVVTIAPILVGGINPFADGPFAGGPLAAPCLALPLPLADPRWEAYGRDIVLDAVPDWDRGATAGPD